MTVTVGAALAKDSPDSGDGAVMALLIFAELKRESEQAEQEQEQVGGISGDVAGGAGRSGVRSPVPFG